MTARFTESVVEDAALAWLESLGYAILHGPEIAPGEPFAERDDYGEVVLESRLRQALRSVLRLCHYQGGRCLPSAM